MLRERGRRGGLRRSAVRRLVMRFARSGQLTGGMDAAGLVVAYAEYAGVEIVISEADLSTARVCGATVMEPSPAGGPARFEIVCPRTVVGWHRDHIIRHELGHIMCGHLGVGAAAFGPFVEAQAEYAASLLATWQQVIARAYPGELSTVQQPRYDAVREPIAWL